MDHSKGTVSLTTAKADAGRFKHGMDAESLKSGILNHLEFTLGELPEHVDSKWEPYVGLALAVRELDDDTRVGLMVFPAPTNGSAPREISGTRPSSKSACVTKPGCPAAAPKAAKKDATKQAAPAPAAPSAAAAAAGGAEPTLIGQFGTWGAYTATPNGKKVCFALAKPSSSKGRYLKKVTVSSTMSPGVGVDPTRSKPAEV